MEIQADIRRHLALHDISIDLPVAGTTRCVSTISTAAGGCIDYCTAANAPASS